MRRRSTAIAVLLAMVLLAGIAPGAYAASGSSASACATRAPRQARLTRLKGTRVRLSWRAPTGATPVTYRVLRSAHTIGQTTGRSMVVAVRLSRRTTFTVQARYAQTPMACSVSLSSGLSFRPPGQVQHLRVLAHTATRVSLGWRRATTGDAPVVGYRIMRDGAVVGEAKHTTFSMKLSSARSHRITVAAVDSRGHLGKLSKAVMIGADGREVPGAGGGGKAQARRVLPGAPAAPSDVSIAEVADQDATVLWVASQPGAAPVVGYRVYRDEELVGRPAGTSLRLTNLSSKRTYAITVTAVDAAGREGPPSAPVRLSTTHTAPTSPTNLSAPRVTDSSATLSWLPGKASSGALEGYLLYQDGQPKGLVPSALTTVALASQRSYSFMVRSRDSWGYLSAPSNDLPVVTTHTPPSTPGGLSATEVTYQSATVQWAPSTAVSGQIIGYRVFRGEVPVGQTEGTTLTLSSLASSSDYQVTVEAVDSLGAVSPPTAPLTIHTADPPPTHGNVQAFLLATTDQSFDDLQAHYQQIGVVYPTYYECGAEGVIEGNDDPLVTHWAVARKIAVMPRLNCQNPPQETKILTELPTRERMINGLVSLCETYGYQGIQIDFEGAPPSDREPFTAFITLLAARLHALGDKLSTIVTAKTSDVKTGRAAMYDDAALSVPSDYIFVLDWGLHWTTSAPGAMDDLPWSTKVADYVATMPNRSKFVLGLPLYGIDWAGAGGAASPGTPLEYESIVALESQLGVTPEWEPVAAAPYFHYTDGNGVTHTVWYTDQQSLQKRLELAASLGLGVGLWHLGSEDQSVWNLPGLGGAG
jgi:spore germination protein YaaH